MSDLLKDYFKRDLSEAEEDRLSEELLASEENTDVFLKEARAYYEKAVPSAARPPFWRPALLGFLSGAALTAALFVWFTPRSEAPRMDTPTVVAQTKVEPPPRPESRRKTTAEDRKVELTLPAPTASGPQTWDAGQRYSRWNGVVHQKVGRLVTIRILGAQDQEVRLLFAGFLQPGSWVFEWDGRNKDNVPTPAGSYFIEAQSGKDRVRKAVQIESTETLAR